MTRSNFTAALRWLFVVPVAFFAGGTAAWLLGFLSNFTHTFNVIADANSIERQFYAVAADFAYGWAFVAAGTATAPSRRSSVAIVLICILVVVMSYAAYSGSLEIGVIFAALRTAGYIGGAALAVWVAIVEGRSKKASA